MAMHPCIKVVLLGTQGVGKSSLARALSGADPDDDEGSSVKGYQNTITLHRYHMAT
jgi:GTPase SAR1 family protein